MKTIAKWLPLVSMIAASAFFRCAEESVDNAAGNPDGAFANAAAITGDIAFPNPERGWYRSMETHSDSAAEELAGIKRQGLTLVLLEANLGEYREKPLDERKLDEIDAAFENARRAGLSAMFRAAYSFTEKSNPDPKDIRVALNHIRQLGPIFRKHEDILFNVQAGFFGPWGEWHSSYYGAGKDAPVKPEYQRMLVNALLEEVPESVTVALRRPEYIRNIADASAPPAARGDHPPVAREEAFGASKIARLAFHNDALMSEETDMDTYIAPNYPRNVELAWIGKHTRYTPMVAETNKVSRYNDAERAIAFLDSINIVSLNDEYHPGVLKKWKNARRGGMSAYAYIGMMMGYRFELARAKVDESPLYGGSLCLDLELANSGFGHLLKEKKFELVLKKGAASYRAGIDEDARFWNKNERIARKFYFRLPSDIAPGNWDAYLSLSSPFKSLAGNPAYALRFANRDIWDPKTGLNKIGSLNLTITGSGGKELSQIAL